LTLWLFGANVGVKIIYHSPMRSIYQNPRRANYFGSVFCRAVGLATAGWFVACTAFGQSCVAPPAGLLAWWPAEGNTLDIAGTNNGQIIGGVTFAPGKVGQAFMLDGTSGYVLVTNSPSLDDVSHFTVLAWVRPTGVSGSPDLVGIIVNKEVNSSASSGIEYEMGRRNTTPNSTGSGIPTGNLAFYVGGVTGLTNDSDGWVDGYGALPLNTWTFVGLSYDGSTVRAFVNGVLSRAISVGGVPNSNHDRVRFGARTSSPPEACFAGLIDEPVIFNRALSTNEVASIYAAGNLGLCRPLTLSSHLSPPNFAFSFPTVSNQSYTVEWNTNLASTNWMFQTNLIGDGSILQFTTPATNATQNFFRARQP
jgi:hypothetical protein